MRIAMICNSRAAGGVERYTADVARGLSERGHEIVLFAPDESPIEHIVADTRVDFYALDLGLPIGYHRTLGSFNVALMSAQLSLSWAKLRSGRILALEHARKPFDAIHVQFHKERFWVDPFAKANNIPVVWTMHAPLEPWMRQRVALRTTTVGIDSAAVIAANKATAHDLIEIGFSPEQLCVIYNGVSRRFASGDVSRVRNELGLSQDSLIALVPARPYWEKGMDVLIDAAALPETHDVTFIVAGGSRHVDGFTDSVAERGLTERIRFLGQRHDMPDLYAAADMVCLPSRAEGLPYAVTEAMVAGCPVVATDVGGITEAVNDGVTGIVVAPEDVKGFAEAVGRLATDADLRASMGDAAHTKSSLFDMTQMLDATERVFAHAIDRNAQRV